MRKKLKQLLSRAKRTGNQPSRDDAPGPGPSQPVTGSAQPIPTSHDPSSTLNTSTTPPNVTIATPDASNLKPDDSTRRPVPGLQEPTSSTNRSARGTSWSGLKALSAVLKDSVGVFGPLESAVEELFRCVETFEEAVEANDEYKKLKTELDALFGDLSSHLGKSGHPMMTPIMENIAKSIEHEVEFVSHKMQRNGPRRFAEAMEDANEIQECYQRISVLLGRLTLNANISMWRTIEEEKTDGRLKDLPNAPAAKYRSAESDSLRRVGCTPNTRVQLLETLRAWADDDTSERVYWLNGMAGTGKTTVAYSLCDYLNGTRQLGASFFCTRQLPSCRDVNKIIPSIAYQLSMFSRPFRYALSQVLERDPDVHNQPLSEQFKNLVVVPLEDVAHTFSANVVVVIDALDECDNLDGTDRILGALLSYAPNLAIRFFVTSRPEAKIADRMRHSENAEIKTELHLHDLTRSIVQKDIRTYLVAKLQHAGVFSADLDTLAEQSGVLFIYAATIVRYLEYDNFSRVKKRLKVVLGASDTPNNSEEDVDALYTTILKATFDDNGLEDSERAEIRVILHTIICAQEPLSLAVISGLLGLDGASSVRTALRPLSSVLNTSAINDSEFVTTLHESFPNYLLNQRRSRQFFCDASQHNEEMALMCFNQIKAPNPPINICKLESSYVFDRDVPYLWKRINEAISAELFYACRYWNAHLELSSPSESLINALSEFLSVRLLLWMEVMNLMRHLHHGAKALDGISSWCEGSQFPDNLRSLGQDAYKFLTMVSSSPISLSTPHIYVSALVFWPEASPVSRCYLPRLPGLSKVKGTAIDRRAGKPAPLTIYTYDSVFSVAYSPDGQHVLSGSRDRSISFWDSRTGHNTKVFRGHVAPVHSVAYSPDGVHAASGSEDTDICIWDIHGDHSASKRLKGHTDAVISLAYSPNGFRLASGSQDRTVRIWDTQTCEMVVGPLGTHTRAVISVAYSPDGAYLLSCCADDAIRIWNACTGQLTRRLPAKFAMSAIYSPGGTHIASGCEDHIVRIWDTRTGQVVGQSLGGHVKPIGSLAYSPDGDHIVSGSWDSTICIWDAHTGCMIGQPLEYHSDSVYSVAYSPDGGHILSGSHDGTVCIWKVRTDLEAREPLDGHANSVNSIAFSPNGASVISGSADGTIRTWDPLTGQMIGEPLRIPAGGKIESVAYTPNGHIVSNTEDGSIHVWDAYTGQLINQIPKDSVDDAISFEDDSSSLEDDSSLSEDDSSPLDDGSISSVACSPNGESIAFSSSDRFLRTWNIRTNRIVKKPLMRHSMTALAVAYSPDGAYLASSPFDETVHIWEAQTGSPVRQLLHGHTDMIFSIAYSPDGAYIASGSEDKTICLWEVHTGRLIGRPLTGHNGPIRSVAYSPDGAYVVSGSADCSVCIWDAHTGQMVGHPLGGHTDSVRSVAYSPDGAYIASGSEDKTIRFWSPPESPKVQDSPDLDSSPTSEASRAGQYLSHWFSELRV
ncbi:hypothetical protein FS749_000620 [Ceratobasidium sp. UAMH 11750]|nr:hypothetical protein FS749_000620 [Ceratobasidium sp. UAMH 11750]